VLKGRWLFMPVRPSVRPLTHCSSFLASLRIPFVANREAHGRSRAHPSQSKQAHDT